MSDNNDIACFRGRPNNVDWRWRLLWQVPPQRVFLTNRDGRSYKVNCCSSKSKVRNELDNRLTFCSPSFVGNVDRNAEFSWNMHVSISLQLGAVHELICAKFGALYIVYRRVLCLSLTYWNFLEWPAVWASYKSVLHNKVNFNMQAVHANNSSLPDIFRHQCAQM